MTRSICVGAERSHLLVENAYGTNQLCFLKHGHHEQSSDATEFDAGNGQRIALKVGSIGPIIVDMNGPARSDDTAERR